MEYEIKITYDTGDSFSTTTGVEGKCGLVWNNLDMAKLSLSYIKEHNEFCKFIERYYYKSNKEYKEMVDASKKRPWYRDKCSDLSLFLVKDDGEKFVQSSFWTGYFENLTCAEIIEVNPIDDGMKYYPK